MNAPLLLIDPETGEILDDTLQGDTVEEKLYNAVIAEDDDLILVTGIKERITVLKGRLERIEQRIEKRRGWMELELIQASMSHYEMAIATVSLSKKPPSVVIDEEREIPTQFFKRSDPVLDKAGLNRLLKERHKALNEATKIKDQDERAARMRQIDTELPPIPGAHLETDQTTLMIRRK